MSKLAVIRQYSQSPAAGGFLGSIVKGIGKFIGRGLGIIKAKAPQVVETAVTAARNPKVQAALAAAAAGAGTAALLNGGGGGGGGAARTYYRRRGRGITARELRGYRKVARLLHQEGMVSRRARGRK